MDILYEISELCKENDISFKICDGYIIIEWIGLHQYSNPLCFSQAFSLYEIEMIYKNVDNVIDEFLSRRDAALENFTEEEKNEQ